LESIGVNPHFSLILSNLIAFKKRKSNIFIAHAMRNPMMTIVIIANKLGKKVITFPRNLLNESVIAAFQISPMGLTSFSLRPTLSEVRVPPFKEFAKGLDLFFHLAGRTFYVSLSKGCFSPQIKRDHRFR
jgi:hypothetical protein